MSTPLDTIKAQIAREFGETGRFDPARWIAQHPEWSTEIATFIEAFASVDPPRSEPWHDRGGHLRRLQNNIQRVVEIRKADEEETKLGLEVSSFSGPAVVKPRDRTWKETKAAVMVFVVDVFRRVRRGHTGRYDANKSIYLDERLLRLDLFRGFKPARLGMWNPRLTTIEREAAEHGWLQTEEAGRRLRAGPQLDEALEVAHSSLTNPKLAERLTLHLADHQPDLELWGMVDYAARTLVEGGSRISTPAVVEVLKAVPEWEWKDHLHEFVPGAIEHLVRLELIPADQIDFE